MDSEKNNEDQINIINEKNEVLHHAFYSQKQADIIKKDKLGKNQGYSYWLSTNGTKIMATSVFNIKDYPAENDCKLYFNDYKYVGMVYKWLGH
tara:strand:+ start:1068 stop:1346 length:279 start_codon:yes stop_codon:yes gene_type:complete